MNTKIVLICLILMAAIATAEVAAQPLFREVRPWYFNTDSGPIGYREVEEETGGHRQRFVLLGPFGMITLDTSQAIVGTIALVLAMGICVIALLKFRFKSRLVQNSTSQNGGYENESTEGALRDRIDAGVGNDALERR